MISYLISPPDESTWRLDSQAFADALRAQWPTAKLEQGAPPFAPLVWEVRGASGHLVIGRVAPERDAIWLRGDISDLADFAVWFRAQVPASERLLFYDEMFADHVALTSTITAEEIARPFLA